METSPPVLNAGEGEDGQGERLCVVEVILVLLLFSCHCTCHFCQGEFLYFSISERFAETACCICPIGNWPDDDFFFFFFSISVFVLFMLLTSIFALFLSRNILHSPHPRHQPRRHHYFLCLKRNALFQRLFFLFFHLLLNKFHQIFTVFLPNSAPQLCAWSRP